jgi:dolichol-phosphate mannosyltransferase
MSVLKLLRKQFKLKTLVISPTYNEVRNIEILISQVLDDSNYDLLIIDDNSPDGTGEKVKKFQKKYSNLFLESRQKKLGLGTAYLLGFNWAIKEGYESIVQIDADLSHDPKDIAKLVNGLKDYDLVIGSRYVQGVSVVNWPIRRLILSYGANIYTKIITGIPINDGTGGFKAWRVDLLKKIKLGIIKSQGYSFQIEMNFRAWRKEARIYEEPIIFVDRTIGESKMSKKIMFEAIWIVIRLRILKLFGLE